MFIRERRRQRSTTRVDVEAAREMALRAKARALKARQERIDEFCRDKAAEWNGALWYRLVRVFWDFGDWTPESAREYYDGGGLALVEGIEWDCFVKQSYHEQVKVAEDILVLCDHSTDGMITVSSDDMEYLR